MTSFLFGLGAGLLIFCSFAGWGWLILKSLGQPLSGGPGRSAAVGLAFTVTAGGVLNLFHLISHWSVLAVVTGGALLALVATVTLLSSAGSSLQSSFHAWRAYLAPAGITAVIGLVAVLVASLKFITAVSPGSFHHQDDYHAYFVFPVKMLQTGFLGPDPFSERRLISSLGGMPFLDTLPIALTGHMRNLHLPDMGIGFLMLLLVLAEFLYRKRAPQPWASLLILATALLPAPISNLTAVYTAAVLFLVMFDLIDEQGEVATWRELALWALLLSALASLKTTFAPAAGAFCLSLLFLRWGQQWNFRKALTQTLACGGLMAAFLTPWMIESYRESKTLFYPFLGKGYHGSQYGIFLLPTSHLGTHNVLAFFHDSDNTLYAVFLVLIMLLWFNRKKLASGDRIVALTSAAIALFGMLVIAVGTGGVQVYRYSFAVVFPAVLFLLGKELLSWRASQPDAPSRSYGLTSAILLIGLLIGTGWDSFAAEQKDWRIDALEFSLSGQDIVSPGEVEAYHQLQSSIPAGETVVVRLDKNFLFDFRRNSIYINDLPGGASLPPGIPIFQGPEPLANYFLQHGIRYVAYSYGDEATFSKAEFRGRLLPNVNVWLRVGAQIAFDYQDNLVSLGQTRKKTYDDGKMYVLDLASKVGPASTLAAGPSAKPREMAVVN